MGLDKSSEKSEKKRVLLITSRSDVGGGPKHVLELSKELRKSYQNQIELFIASPTNKPHYQSYINLCTKHFEIPHRSFSVISVIKLVIFCLRNKITCIHSHGRGAGIYSRILWILGIKILHSHHGIHPSYRLKNLVEKILNIFTHKHILISKSEYETGLNLGLFSQKNSIIIENGINIEESELKLKDTSTINICEKYNIIDSDIILATLSRLDKHKGNHLLIEKFNYLVRQEPTKNYKLLIAGDGEEKDGLNLLIQNYSLQNKVHLLGNLENPFELLKIAHIYVSHSKGEGLPYSILEAFLANLPCLLSDVPGHQGLVDEKQLFTDKNNFSAKLFKSLKHDSSGENNYKNLCQNYSLNSQVRQLTVQYL